jgi:uncharacterized protein (DUF1778 family)
VKPKPAKRMLSRPSNGKLRKCPHSLPVTIRVEQAEKDLFRRAAQAERHTLSHFMYESATQHMGQPINLHKVLPATHCNSSEQGATIMIHLPVTKKAGCVDQAKREGRTLTDFFLNAAWERIARLSS